MIKDVKCFCIQTFVLLSMLQIFFIWLFFIYNVFKSMLKSKRTSCAMLCYTLCSLYVICSLMLKCQVLPFLIHGTCISYANVHLVSKQDQRSTLWIYHGRFYTYAFSKVSNFGKKILTTYYLFNSINMLLLGNFLHISLLIHCTLMCLCILFAILVSLCVDSFKLPRLTFSLP